MTTVALFHSVLGVRQGVLDAAQRLRQDGHEVHVVDPYDGRTFDDYTRAMDFAWKEVGHKSLMERAVDAVADLPDGFVPAGFSLGCVLATLGATRRISTRQCALPEEYDPVITETFWSRVLPFVGACAGGASESARAP